MEYTLWRGDVLLGRADLQPGGHPNVLRGSMQHTPELDQLGPIAQHSLPGAAVVQHSLPRASEWPEGASGDLDVVEIYESSGEPATAQSPSFSEVTSDQSLRLRSANGTEVPAQLISVMVPPTLPDEVTKMRDARTLEQLQQWRLMCALAVDGSHAA